MRYKRTGSSSFAAFSFTDGIFHIASKIVVYVCMYVCMYVRMYVSFVYMSFSRKEACTVYKVLVFYSCYGKL